MVFAVEFMVLYRNSKGGKMNNKSKRNSGLGIVSILTLILIILKITNKISWSWIWVLSPIWITFIFAIIIFAIILIVGKIKKGKR